ncbi:Pentatricopeptide repeat-containing protein [Arachis hypogaea]|nr:Pentatricopeptide repeat-containing protein [Arachis hypogaea]
MEHDVFVGKVFGTDEFNVLLKAFCTQRQMTEARSVFVKMVPRAQQPQVVYLSISASSPDKTIFQIENSGVIACLRANSAEVAYEAANAAIADGISLVLNQLVKEHLTTSLGVGNVLRIEDAKANGEVLYIPGTMTPTEILSVCEAGAKIVKKPFPHVSMVASQGINIDSIEEYISRGASAVVLSDAIFEKETIAKRNYEKIQKLAHFAALLGNKV